MHSAIVAWAAFLMVFASLPCRSDSARMLDPFDGVDQVAVRILIGGDLRIGSGVALRLFDGDVSRANRFSSELMFAIREGLERCHVRENDSAPSELQIGIFGGPVDAAAAPVVYMFLVQLALLRGEEASDRESFSMRFLGSAENSHLEGELISTVVSALEEATHECGT